MDSEHRHELKTNELADLLTHFPQFLKRNASTIIGLTLIVIALVTWPLLSKRGRQKEIAEDTRVSESIQLLNQDIGTALKAIQDNPDQVNQSLNSILTNAEALLEVASETDNPNLSALASIKAAQAIRTELHLQQGFVDDETISEQTQKAQQAYEKAAQMATLPALKAMAQFGIGLCAEERGQIEQARDIYTEIVLDETYKPTVFPTMAQKRLDELDENAKSFVFAPAPEPEEMSPAGTTTEMQMQPSGSVEADTGTESEQVQPADTPSGENTVLNESADGQPMSDQTQTPVSEPDTAATDSQE